MVGKLVSYGHAKPGAGLGLETCISWPASWADLLDRSDLEQKILVDEVHFVYSICFESLDIVCDQYEDGEWTVLGKLGPYCDVGEEVWSQHLLPFVFVQGWTAPRFAAGRILGTTKHFAIDSVNPLLIVAQLHQ